ncbi:MAG TPA: hypothetical protein VGN73_11480 [Gemmatimonadaceae bacterium]|jgi:DNA-binding NtrC family response regulator|nr:hypothetical protein [Gemmatimonadaceae bacterium]
MIETILVVVGDAVLREFTTVVLRSYGYTVLVASDVGSSVSVAGAHRGPINLFVTDINPGLNGAELPQVILTNRPKLRFLYLFGHTYHDFVRGGLGPRVRLLHKLFSPMSLARTVRDTLESARKDDTG